MEESGRRSPGRQQQAAPGRRRRCGRAEHPVRARCARCGRAVMKRLLSIAFLFILAALVGAQGDGPRVTPAQQAAMLEKNRDLMKITIQSGLDLTEDPGP